MRQKKQLSTLDNVTSLSDQELREALKQYDQAPGPITETTRSLYQRKLVSLIETSPLQANAAKVNNQNDKKTNQSDRKKGRPTDDKAAPAAAEYDDDDDDDDDTSDEDFNILDEDEEEEETEDSDEEDEEYQDDEEDSDELLGELEEDGKLTSTTADRRRTLISRILNAAYISPKWTVIVLITLFIGLFSIYLQFGGNLSPKITAYKQTAKSTLLTIAILATISYPVYFLVRFFHNRRRTETQRVCLFVKDALELLQSPDNPTGQMPILHIRDTLLTPTERKRRDMINLWNKAVEFVENHESRVKVELVNVEGEDFRAWKWIGPRKL